MLAAHRGRTGAVNLLLERGADVNLVTEVGNAFIFEVLLEWSDMFCSLVAMP